MSYHLPVAQPSLLAPDRRVRKVFNRPGPRAYLRVGAAGVAATVYVNGHCVCTHVGAWTPFEIDITPWLEDENEVEIVCVDRDHTTNGFLPVLGARWTGARDVEIRTSPTTEARPATQRSSTRGTQLLVDGRPFRVRGILHWGYYPELEQPWPTEAQMLAEIEQIRALGFNLIKFCLWVPPPRYYALCEEMGMFVWQEYPVWDAPLTETGIISEYEALFRNDRPYSCVILRTLTCENDRIAPELGRLLVDLCHKMIPGSLVLDNSAWLCSERDGDFHDEHPYLNNMQWSFYAARTRKRLTKPLLLGETNFIQNPPGGPYDTALAVRRFQIETLTRDLPDAGYVINAIRDAKDLHIGIFTEDGRPKYTADEWAWHGREPAVAQFLPPASSPIIGPRKGEWKCPEHAWHSSIVKVNDAALPAELITRELMFELLSGRVLSRCEGTRVLVELRNPKFECVEKLPLVIEFKTQGVRRVVSAFRHDTPAGRELWNVLAARDGDVPEIGPLVGTSIVLEDWEMSTDRKTWEPVKCDTPLINGGRNVFEGWAYFRTGFDYPGGVMTLQCEAVGDYYEFYIDGERMGEAGPRVGTWNGTRDTPRQFTVDLTRGKHDIEFHVRDWRAAGGMVGPVYFAHDLDERVF